MTCTLENISHPLTCNHKKCGKRTHMAYYSSSQQHELTREKRISMRESEQKRETSQSLTHDKIQNSQLNKPVWHQYQSILKNRLQSLYMTEIARIKQSRSAFWCNNKYNHSSKIFFRKINGIYHWFSFSSLKKLGDFVSQNLWLDFVSKFFSMN